MPYRDEYEKCPRCNVELEDAGSVRACSQCRGQWVPYDVLMEMAGEMSRPNRPRMHAMRDEGRAALLCPGCGKAMGTWKLRKVDIDRCEAHGVWFDKDELEAVLLATFEPA